MLSSLLSLLRSKLLSATKEETVETVLQETVEAVLQETEVRNDCKSERILADAEADAARLWEIEKEEDFTDL